MGVFFFSHQRGEGTGGGLTNVKLFFFFLKASLIAYFSFHQGVNITGQTRGQAGGMISHPLHKITQEIHEESIEHMTRNL